MFLRAGEADKKAPPVIYQRHKTTDKAASFEILGSIQAADAIGIRGLLVQALSAEAKAFYEHIGFDQSALDPMTLMITLADLKASLTTRHYPSEPKESV